MVDAINSINVATRSVAQERKDYTIDWKKLTANQVLEYADKGEDIPVEILKWAEDYVKLTNVPDDVSYEAVNGSTESDEARAVEEAEKEGTTEEIDNEESEETSEEDNEENAELTPYEQAGILIQESNTSNGVIQNASTNAMAKINEEQSIAESSEQQVTLAESEVTPKRNEYEGLLNKISTDETKITPSDLKNLDKVYKQLTDVGNKEQSALTSYDEQLNEIEAVFSQYDLLPPPGYSKAAKTIDIGQLMLLMANSDGDNINLSYYIRGMQAIGAGSKLSGTSYIGENIFLAGHEANQESVDKVVDGMDKVEELTLVKGSRASAEKSEENDEAPENVSPTDNNNPETKTESEKEASSTNKTDDKGIKDSTILVDDIEIKRRKENRGEIPAES